MLMSQAATSCAVAARPKAGADVPGEGPVVDVAQAPASAASATVAITFLCENIGYAPVGFDRPGLDRVVVIALLGHVLRKPCRARGLHPAFLVDRPALQQSALAVPLPRQPEARHTLGEHRLLQHRVAPARSAVSGYFDLADL